MSPNSLTIFRALPVCIWKCWLLCVVACNWSLAYILHCMDIWFPHVRWVYISWCWIYRLCTIYQSFHQKNISDIMNDCVMTLSERIVRERSSYLCFDLGGGGGFECSSNSVTHSILISLASWVSYNFMTCIYQRIVASQIGSTLFCKVELHDCDACLAICQ